MTITREQFESLPESEKNKLRDKMRADLIQHAFGLTDERQDELDRQFIEQLHSQEQMLINSVPKDLTISLTANSEEEMQAQLKRLEENI